MNEWRGLEAPGDPRAENPVSTRAFLLAVVVCGAVLYGAYWFGVLLRAL